MDFNINPEQYIGGIIVSGHDIFPLRDWYSDGKEIIYITNSKCTWSSDYLNGHCNNGWYDPTLKFIRPSPLSKIYFMFNKAS